MYKKASAVIILLLAVSIFLNTAYAQNYPQAAINATQQQSAVSNMTDQQKAATMKNLTPAQQQAVQAELMKSGGILTPQAIEAIKNSPEFKSLKPEEVIKGKKLLEKRNNNEEEKQELNAEQKKVRGEEVSPSLFERSHRIGKYQDIQLELKPFGYDFFNDAAVSIITDRKDIPVPAKYIVGPGDEVNLLLWGRVNAQYNLTIDRNGSITIPQIGPLYVAGMTFEQMSAYLIKQSKQIVGANIDITMGGLKTIPVFILGDVKRPGAYIIGSFATITDALLLAGGPTDIGSMRNIQLKRKDQVITNFDLYNLLLKGDKGADVTLQAGDVVFVPVCGPLVGIAGNIKRPAIYELKDKRDLMNLIEFAGGIIPTAYTQQIQVERIVKGERQIIVDINDKNLEKAGQTNLQDADLVKIFAIVDANMNAIYLNGNVKRPGKYEYRVGMTIKDILSTPDELLPETHYDYALIKRRTPPSMEPSLIPFNLGKFLFNQDKVNTIALQPLDQIFIFNKWFFKNMPFVTVEGEIRGNPRFENTWEPAERDNNEIRKEFKKTRNERGNQKFENTGKQTAKGNNEIRDEFKTTRDERGNPKFENTGEPIARGNDGIHEELKTMRDDLSKDPQFYLLASKLREIEDEIGQEGRPVIRDLRYLQGELERIGRLDLKEQLKEIEKRMRVKCSFELAGNMKVKDAILNSGGLTNNAYLESGEIIRKNTNKEYMTVYFNVAKALSDDPKENLLLQDGDQVIIHSIWENIPKRSVFVDGDVTNPGPYQYTEKMTVRDLVFKAGNVLESAYLDDAEITTMVLENNNVSKIIQKNINLKKALEGDEANNIKLNPYDRLLVKKITDWRREHFVTVAGQFKFPGKYILRKGEKLSSLIQRAGGYTDSAYLRGAIFTRERVKEMQQKSIEDMALRLEKELLSQGSAQVSTALSSEEIQGKQFEIAQKKQLIENMKSLKALGRMTVKLAHLRLLKGSEYDIELEDGDSLSIPEKNSVVSVVGSVMGQGSYVFSEKADYLDYINMSGGYSTYADESNVFFLKVDGSARKARRGLINWNEKKDRMEMAAFSDEETNYVEPGDVIVVPEKIEQIAWLRNIRDITQIIMNTAVVAGVIIKLF